MSSTGIPPARIQLLALTDVNALTAAPGRLAAIDGTGSGVEFVEVAGGAVDSVDGKTGVVTLGDLYAPIVHTHDDRYYTEAESDTLLAGKSDVGHGHAIADVADLQASLDAKLAVAGLATQAEAEAGTDNTKWMSPLRVIQALATRLINYALLAGRAGGQTISGGTGAGETLTLRGTSDATPGTVYLNGATAHVDTAGNVRVGGYNVADLAAKTFASGRNGSNIVDIYAADATAGGRPILLFSRSRGTTAAPAAVQDGDWLGTFQANAWQGVGFAESARIMFQVDGPVTSGQRAPGKIVLMTAPSGGSTTARITIGAAGQVEISGVRDAVDDAAAAALSPAVPVNGLYRTGSTLKIRVS